MAAGIVRDHRMGDPVTAQFERRQRRPLVARPRLVHPDMHVDPPVMRQIDRRQRGPPIHRRQPAGIAMGQHIHAPARCGGVRDQPHPMRADRRTQRDVLIGDRRGFGVGARNPRRLGRGTQHRQHPVERPTQVHRRRPRRPEQRRVALQRRRRGILAQRQAQSVGRHRPDQRRATHLHRPDCVRRRRHIGEAQQLDLPRQPGLVEDAHRPAILLIHPDAAIGRAVDLHEILPRVRRVDAVRRPK